MKPIGGLLSRGRPGERAEFSAAFVIGAMNEALQKVMGISDADARAISFRQGTIIVGVSHGAVAGLVQQAVEKILTAANAKIKTSGHNHTTIAQIITRPMTPPSP